MFVPTTIVELAALVTDLEADPSVKVDQQSRKNLGPWLYSKGDLGNRESKREMLRSGIGGTARFEKGLYATVPPSRR